MGTLSICTLLPSSASFSSNYECVSMDSGSLDKASTFAFVLEDLYLMLYWYADSCIAHRCNREGAIFGIPIYGPNNKVRGC